MTSIIRPLIGAALTAALLTPASAIAAPHWSSPVKVSGPAADPRGIATPKAFVASDGRSLAVFSDGLRPALSAGTVGGAFAAPLALGTDASGSGGVDAALGANGTLAVAWTAGGGAHVAVGPAGERGTETDLPGANVSDVAVAVAADGTTTVAYRTKPAANSYELVAATAAPGAGFGAPVTLHTSGQGIDGLDAAAGPGGAVAIAYRRLAPRYRAYAVVRPAGAAAFGSPQALSPATSPDIATRIAFDADGTIVAAWTNYGGAAYALRAPGATSFGSPSPLGPAGEQTYLLDLAPTPQGGTAVTWSAAGQIKAAIKAPGAGFGDVQNVLPENSEIAVQPVITAQPGGPVTVAVNDPGSGAVTAVDLGAGKETIGYGPVQIGTPMAIASSSDRTIVLFRDASGSLSAVTRSEQAPPSTGPGTAPAPADHKAPKLTLQAPRRMTVTRKTTSISFYVRCDEPCTLSAASNMRTTRGKKKLVSPLNAYTTKKPLAGRQLVKLRLSRSTQSDLRRALAKKRGATVFFDVTASDAAGNSVRRKGQIALHGAKAKRHH